jgi:integrase
MRPGGWPGLITARPSYRALVMVGADGGLRIGELAGLRRSRVDLLRGTVEVAEIVTEVVAGCGWGHQDPGQPPHRRAATCRRRGAGRAPGKAGSTRRLRVRGPKGGPLRVIAFRARIWRPATRNAGLDGLRIHDLRHTAVALWIAAGANLRRWPPGPGIPR